MYRAEAYHCDARNVEIPLKLVPQKTIFDNSVRICVRPDEVARGFGMTISSIDSWNFTRDELRLFQPAILPQGLEAVDGTTILVCVAGSPTCAFRTKLHPDFYQTDGTVKGIGLVWLQYPGMNYDSSRIIGRRLEEPVPIVPKTEEEVDLPPIREKPLTFAGESDVGVDTPVGYRDPVIPEHCLYEQEVYSWWLEEDINDRYMYIAITVMIATALCCLLAVCAFCPLGRDRREERITEEEVTTEGQTIKVNVDVKNNETRDLYSSTTHSSTDSKNISLGNGESSHTSSTDTKSTEDEERAERRRARTPADEDVCFNQPKHPGTKKFNKSVSKVVESNIGTSYTPQIYKAILVEFGEGRRFYSREKNGKYVEVSKKERIELIGETFKAEMEKRKKDVEIGDIENGRRKREEYDEDRIVPRRRSSRSNLQVDEDSKDRRGRRRSSSNRSLRGSLEHVDNDGDILSPRRRRRSSSNRSVKDEDDNRRLRRSSSNPSIRHSLNGGYDKDSRRMRRSNSHKSLKETFREDKDKDLRMRRSSSNPCLKSERRSSSSRNLRGNLNGDKERESPKGSRRRGS